MIKERIDIHLVKKNIIESREKAKKYIMAGYVLVNNEVVDKPGTKIDIESDIRLRGSPLKYVSRGGFKLEKAILTFGINLKEKVAIDVGASTGGFTDCMLQNGARKVYSIDVGYGQLDWKLVSDNRVVVMDKTNIRKIELKDIGEEADFISIDTSFISLDLVLPVVNKLLNSTGEITALIKPQFEVGKQNLGKNGVVKDPEKHKYAIMKVIHTAKNLGLCIENLTYSPLKGPAGNIEYLLYLTKGGSNNIVEEDITKIVKKSHSLID